MKKHFKINPEKKSLGYSAKGKPIKGKPYKVNHQSKYNAVYDSLVDAIQKARENQAIASFIVGEDFAPKNINLSIDQDPTVPVRLALKQLDNTSITLLSVSEHDGEGGGITANISIENDKIDSFVKKITDYKNGKTKSGNYKHKDLVEPIKEIRFTSLKDLWVSSEKYPEDRITPISVELWLDLSQGKETIESIEHKISNCAKFAGVTIQNQRLIFKDRMVKIATGTIEAIESLHEFTGIIVEVRPAKTLCSEYMGLPPKEQYQWAESMVLTKAPNPAQILIMDRGVNIAHPLLDKVTDSQNHVSYDPNWPAGDQHGHGTWMAGVSIYGDLKHTLQNTSSNITAELESAKIATLGVKNHKSLYGTITSDVVYQIDTIKPSDRRIYTLAVTADYTLLGTPSSWSAKVDELACETPDDPTSRLFVISAGNFLLAGDRNIPDDNINNTVQDPACAYNAITVGYWASEGHINHPDYELFSDLTDIGPTSTSSISWRKNSPLKPDVVFEGGNFGYDPTLKFSSNFDELSILTVSHDFASTGQQFYTFNETSAATALASKFASEIWAKYPDYRPETIRALMVHSASWPEKIKSRFFPFTNKGQIENLIRLVGYGYPDLNKALSSGSKSVSLVIEDHIQPYTADGKMNEMLVYALPWPENELMKLSDETVSMKVTLSYFIEPNPGERGWDNKYKYCSHGLRFETNSAGENREEFVCRINKQFKDKNPDVEILDSDSKNWLLGANLRSKGSIHTDTWTGTAQDLAAKKYIAVYPVAGWWRDLKKWDRQSSVAKFSLIVSIETPSNNLEIYNEIESLVEVPNIIGTEVLISQ